MHAQLASFQKLQLGTHPYTVSFSHTFKRMNRDPAYIEGMYVADINEKKTGPVSN